MSPHERPRWFQQRRVLAGLIFTACLAAYHVNGEALGEVDCVPAPYTAWSLAQQGTFDLRPHPYLAKYVGSVVATLPDGRWVSVYPPGSALAAVPFVPLAGSSAAGLRSSAMRRLGKLVGAAYVAGAAVLFHSSCRALAPSAAGIATVLFAFGTCLSSVASQALWMHGPATFWVCLAMHLLIAPGTDPGPRRRGWAGLALGMAVLTRPTTVLFTLATAAALAVERRWRALACLAIGAAGPIGLLVLYNYAHFGRPLAGGYEREGLAWSTPWWLGTAGLILAPSRGLLVYSPALVLAPLGAWAAAGLTGKRALLWAWLIAGLATILLYGTWRVWWGGWCFGPRFLCETMPIFCLCFGLAYERVQARSFRRVAWILVWLSVAIHFLGVFGHHRAWNQRHQASIDGRAFFSLDDTQIGAHAEYLAGRIAGLAAP